MFSPQYPKHRHTAGRISDIRPTPKPPISLRDPEPLQKKSDWYLPPQTATETPESFQGAFDMRARRKSWKIGRWYFSQRIIWIFFILLAPFLVWGMVYEGIHRKQSVLQEGEIGYRSLIEAGESLKAKQYAGSLDHFAEAERAFQEANESLSFWGDALLDVGRFVPWFSMFVSGKHVVVAGEHLAAAGAPVARIAESVSLSKDAYKNGDKVSFLDFLKRIKEPLQKATEELSAAEHELQMVNIGDIPEGKQETFLTVRRGLPILLGFLKNFDKNETLFEELLGGNGPRRYLFLLQNNHEMRATGGFIGSYALLDVNNGVVRRFFVDGIFNPDGQLRENIVPPKPIQKISAGWSLHDSNWFPDFPMSAEKAIFFYEKTGGPTVDGVIALTPTVMQKLLAVTGPIALPEYGLTVDAENFIPIIQEQVEVKYDKEENKPKKILADLSVALLEKVFAVQDKEMLYRLAQALTEGLNEKHILLYMRHKETQALLDEVGWSGRVLETGKDYVSVVHSNINGYKTDGVIKETIRHRADIASDGSVVDTVTITRTHTGGQTLYDWWNRVNADYLRVYVPKGSKLLSAKGATWEFPEPPLDYEKLGFKRDSDVEREEKTMEVDEKSGTRISTDAEKTVFGAWVYVSPGESVTVEYTYRLPFRVNIKRLESGDVDAYSVLYQKQSGSLGSVLDATIAFPEKWTPIWQTEANLVPYGRELRLKSDLATDRFIGAVFRLESK